jgi:hypothetical protein
MSRNDGDDDKDDDNDEEDDGGHFLSFLFAQSVCVV